MTPEISMRRTTLITELLSVSEASSSVVRPTANRSRCALLLGAVLLTSGCPSSTSLTSYFRKPKTGMDPSALAILKKDQEQSENTAGLPLASKAKSKAQSPSVTKLLDQGQEALSTYYKDANPAHLTEAHRCYEQSLAQESGNPESHHGLAIVCDLQKDYKSAELHYQAALEGDPDNGKMLADLGYSYLLQNRLSESESLLTQALKRDPGNTQATMNLACVYAKQGNYNLADSTFRRVLNEAEVRQEMAALFPNGRPDMAREGESSKLHWRNKNEVTTENLTERIKTSREQSAMDLQEKRTALEMASPPAYTIDQQRAMIAQLTWERDEALRLAEARSQQTSNTPLVLTNSGSVTPVANTGMQIRPQNDTPSANPSDPAYTDVRQTLPNSTRSFATSRRADNAFYPTGTRSQPDQYRGGIEQVSGNGQQTRPNGQQPVDQALHQTDRGIDPRTGMPLNTQIQQMEGQQPLLVPSGIENSAPGGYSPEASTSSRISNFEEAKRRAAMATMGGPESMFPVSNPEGGNRMAPGTGSTFNGGQYPAPQRMLPIDAAPHDLQRLMQAPSGEMTVQPNQMGMLNSPNGRSFSNPNFEQPLSPQIPIVSPLDSQGMSYPDQVNSAQRNSQQQSPYYSQPAHDRSQMSGDSTSALNSQNQYPPNYDSRNRINSELNQYEQSFQYNPNQNQSNSWSNSQTPANGLPNQPQVESANQLITPAWNQRQYTPDITPPPYRRGTVQAGDDGRSSMSEGYGAQNDTSSSMNRRDSSAGAMYSEPPAIYSPGVQSPSSYNSGSRPANTYGQRFDGPRITPAQR